MNQSVDNLTTKFFSKVEKTETCWFWKGNLDKDGYGRFCVGKHCCEHAHRFSFELVNGKTELLVLHSCLNKNCVNPEHLKAGTAKENTADRLLDGTHQLGERNSSAKLTIIGVKCIRSCYLEGITLSQLGREFNVTKQTIFSIVNRKTWKEVK